jgi:sensor histidine kinase regulating citrate/malate metabolism
MTELADWGLLDRSRGIEYVTLQGLSTLTGCEANFLDIFCLKELIDNSLDATLIDPVVNVGISTKEFVKIQVHDNGKGILASYLNKIADFKRYYSTKL